MAYNYRHKRRNLGLFCIRVGFALAEVLGFHPCLGLKSLGMTRRGKMRKPIDDLRNDGSEAD